MDGTFILSVRILRYQENDEAQFAQFFLVLYRMGRVSKMIFIFVGRS